jgi:TM2 domain-containing membrane protein YozV
MGRIFLSALLLLLVFCPFLKANEFLPPVDSITVSSFEDNAVVAGDEKKPELRKKIKAAILTVALGPFGMHRLYLGTKPVVVVFYVFTLGGGLGLIPLIDLVAILAAKDLSKYEHNNRVFMWTK